MNPVRIPRILKIVYPDIVWEIRDEKPSLYLTFDDGPTPDITSNVLSILGQYNARATFFCIGRNVERHPELYRKILEDGHATGNHTYSHLKGWYTPNNEYYKDIELAARFIHSGLYRPAYGMITPAQLRFLQLHYRIVMWDIMSYDFDRSTRPEKCLKNVLDNAHSGSIVVFHDSVKAFEKVQYALPRILEYYNGKGYTFRSIG
jgi:peptidoglycan/xylan/chitin deacetylase (PgdA/CDA1 family)